MLLLFPVPSQAAQTAIAQNGAVYCLRNVGSGKYLNVDNGIDVNGTNVYQWTKDGSVEQRFLLEYSSTTDAYVLRAMCSSSGTNRCVSANSGSAGANVVLGNYTNGTNQRFTMQNAGSQAVYLYSEAGTNLVLGAYGTSNGSAGGTASTSAGNVCLQTYSGSDNQKWVLEPYNATQPLVSGQYYILNANSSRHLTANTSTYNVSQQTGAAASTQKWNVIYTGNGYYYLQPASNLDRRLDVYNAWDINGANIQIHTENGNDAQKYRIIPSGGSTVYRIVPAISSTRAVSVASPYTTDGANVELQEYVGAAYQHWVFMLIEEYDPYADMGWSWVFANNQYTNISSGYRTSARPTHNGIDVATGTAAAGAAIISPTSGTVRTVYKNDKDGGHYVVVTTNSIDPNGNYIHVGFMHMVEGSSPLKEDDTVNAGTFIGNVGTTGDSTGTHLHLCMWNNPNHNNSWNWAGDTNAINPQRFFPQITFTGATSTARP